MIARPQRRRKRLYAALTNKERLALDDFEAKRAAFRISVEPADRAFVAWGIARGASFLRPALGPPKVVWVDSPGILGVAGPLAAAVLALWSPYVADACGPPSNDALDALIGVFAGNGDEGVAVGRAVHAAVDETLARRAAIGPDTSERFYTWDECVVGDANLIYPFVKRYLCEEVTSAVSEAVTKGLQDALDSKFDRAYDHLVSAAEWSLIYEGADAAMGRGDDSYAHHFVRKVFDRTHSYVLPGRAGNVRLRGITRFFRDVVGPEKLRVSDDIWERSRVCDAMLSAGPIWPHQLFWIVSEPPTQLHLEPVDGYRRRSWRLHRTDGPAIAWIDGTQAWYLHDMRLRESTHLFTSDGRALTVGRILAIENIEERRALIEHYGRTRFLRDAGAVRIDAEYAPETNTRSAPSDLRYRALWRFEQTGDEPIVVVDVINQSPEAIDVVADGESLLAIGGRTWKRYMIRVPPAMRTCAEAVAWTFGLTPETYDPIVET